MGLERLPDGAHLVVSGRVHPPLPLARLRARGQMAEVGAADLTFTEEEAGSFLKGVMDLDPSAEDVAKLEIVQESLALAMTSRQLSE